MGSKAQPTVNAVCPECGRVIRTDQGLRWHRRKVHGVIPAEKACTKCHEVKPVSEFPLGNQPNTWQAWCLVCKAEAAVKYRKERPDSHVRRDRKKYIGDYYGMTVEEYDAERARLLEEQQGVCPGCGGEPAVTDHDHAHGHLRGVLCSPCNVALGCVKDSPEVLEKLAEYLRLTSVNLAP